MTSHYVIVSIKLYKEVGNDECIFVCNFGDRRMSGFEVIEGGGGVSEGLPVTGSKKKPGLNRVKEQSQRVIHSTLTLRLASATSCSKFS